MTCPQELVLEGESFDFSAKAAGGKRQFCSSVAVLDSACSGSGADSWPA